MKTEKKHSFRLLSFLMALLMLLSSVPTDTLAVGLENGDIVISNPGNDNEYVVHAAGDTKDNPRDFEIRNGDHTIESERNLTYYKFAPGVAGNVTITLNTSDKWQIMLYQYDAAGKQIGSTISKYNTDGMDTFTMALEQGGFFVIGGRTYGTGKYTYVAGTVTINIQFTSSGGDTPSCQHTEKKAVSNNDGTHNIVCAADGCDYVETENVTCADAEPLDHKCDACKYEMGKCSVSTYTDLKNGTHQAYCACGQPVGEPAEHSYDETTLKCVCGAEKPACDHSYESAQTKDPTCTEKGEMTYTCTKCGNSYTTELPEQGHDMGAYETTTAPTCTEDGVATSSCSRCGHKETQIIPKSHKDEDSNYVCDKCGENLCVNHTPGAPVQENIVPATSCQQGGSYTLVTYCVTCGSVIDSTPVTTDPLPHQFGAYTCTTEPGCTTLGTETASCTYGCGKTKTRYVMALGHNYVDGKCTDCDATEATVGTEANPAPFVVGDGNSSSVTCYYVFYAVMDGKATISAEGTYWRGSAYIVGADNTKKENGTSVHNPKYDGATITRDLMAGDKLVMKISVTGAPADTVITVNFQFTTNCNHRFVAAGIEATCNEVGSMGYTCSVCNTSYAEYSSKLGHDMGDYVQTKAPTCTEKGEKTSCCSRCDYTDVRDVEANGHTMGDYTQTKAPTCTEPGEEAATCSTCGYTETREIPANGHNSSSYIQTKAPTCTAPGEETATCSICGQTDTRSIEALGHDTVTVDHKDATCTEDGVVGGSYCARCEADKADTVNEVIPATGHTYTDGKCFCGAEDPNYVPEGAEGNPKLLTEAGHTFVLESWGSAYYFVYTAEKECAATINATGNGWKIIIQRYNLENKKIGEEEYRPAADATSTDFIVALETEEKIVLKFVVMAASGKGCELFAKISIDDCDHVYDVNCEDGDCNNCNGTRVAPGHDWENKDGVCVTCKFECQHSTYGKNGACSTCGKECDHNWTDATCTTPKTCSKCQKTEGDTLDHDWSNKDGVCVTCKSECQHSDLTETCSICGKEPEIKAVAQIGDTKYETLQQAINAAEDGDIIVLLSDLDLDYTDAQLFKPEEKNDYKAMFIVEGKYVTIDLNGKTIDVDATIGFGEGTIEGFPENGKGMIDWTANEMKGMLMAVIAVHNGGRLTLEDNSEDRTGRIQTKAHDGDKTNTACGIVYSILTNYSQDSSITIEGGRYEADFTRDSLIYTYSSANEGQGNVGVVVHGGFFILGNAGQGRNYSTWIFNAKGQNERHVWVTGGTFSTDIHHQYWGFEAQGPENLALCKNTDGTYTLIPAVAYVAERYGQYTKNVGYTSLEDAINACANDTYRKNTYYASERFDQYANEDKVVLLTDIELTHDIDVTGKSVVIELNGYTLAGKKVIGALIYNNGELINQEENKGEEETTEPET